MSIRHTQRVFISSTSQDLPDHRIAVREAILAVEMYPIDMEYFGSHSDDALTVSLNKVRTADVFIGILAHRYGFIPKGQTKSITESEYDEAQKMNIPCLMYIVDDTYDWDPELKELEPTAQKKLHYFKTNVEQRYVRRLFTTPENLAQSIAIDLKTLQLDLTTQELKKVRLGGATQPFSTSRRRNLTFGCAGAIITFILLLSAMVALIPDIRDDALQFAGLISETVTPMEPIIPTATQTNAIVPSPILEATNTPIPTQIPACTGAPQPQLYRGALGLVLDEDDRALNVRARPGTEFEILTLLPVGQTFRVLDGPICNGAYAWYWVSFGGRGAESGWIAEGDGATNTYFVAPIPGSDFTPPACVTLRIQETFDPASPQSEWFEGSNSRSEINVNGSYEIQLVGLPSSGGEAVSWGSLQEPRIGVSIIEATIRASDFEQGDSSRTGLWLRVQDWTNGNDYLAFLLRSDGSYRIARYQNGYNDLTKLGGWTHHASINLGDNATNRIRIDSFADRFDLYINGTYVESVQDENIPSDGRIVFMGASPSVPATFYMDDIRICDN